MPNFSYTASKAWTPYTFEELIKPLAMYTEEYNRLEEALSELGTKADLLRKQAQEAGGDVANVYNAYANVLDKLADLLARQGLTPSSRDTLRRLHRLYAKDISPIEEAIKYKKSMAEEQRKLRALNPSLMFDRDYSTINLNEIYNNPLLGYTSVSGDELYKQGAAAAKAASMRNTNIGTALSGQYFAIKQGYGYEAAQQFLLNNESIPELHDAIGRIVALSGVTDENKARAIDYVINGMMSGLIYDEKYLANRGYETPSERTSREYHEALLNERKEDRMAKLYGAKMPNGDYVKDVGGGRVRITHPDGKTEVISGDKASSILDEIYLTSKVRDKLLVLAYTNGKWRIGEEGKDVPDTWFGMTRSNVVNTWGDYKLDNISADNIVEHPLTEMPLEAAEKLHKAYKEYNLDPKAYHIVRVKAESSRAAGDYDYILVPKSLLSINQNESELPIIGNTLYKVPYRLPDQSIDSIPNTDIFLKKQ